MSEAQPPEPPLITPSLSPAPRRRGGFVGRLLAALLVIVITTIVALVAGALAYIYVLPAPQQIGQLQARFATSEAQNLALQVQNSVMQTQVAALLQRTGDDREQLSELRIQVEELTALRQQWRNQLTASLDQNATLVADARASRDSVMLFATAEASRAALLSELERRSARVERFLQRLSDISSDAALDLGGGSAAGPTATPAPAETPTLTFTPSLAPTETATPTPTFTPTATSEPLPAPSATEARPTADTASATSTPSERPTARRATASPAPSAAGTARPSGTATPTP